MRHSPLDGGATYTPTGRDGGATYTPTGLDGGATYTPTGRDARYAFEYTVERNETRYQQRESRRGGITQGSYSVLLPDGRIQTVTYTVDGTGGFQADVTYQGEASYPVPPVSLNQGNPAYKQPGVYPSPTGYREPQVPYAGFKSSEVRARCSEATNNGE